MNRRRLAPIARDLLGGLTGDVLEVGAGSGAMFRYYPDAARVVAFEPDRHMRRRAAPNLRPNIRLEEGAGERLPAADGSVDAVVVSLVLCTVSDVPRTLAEIRRVLKPGGKLVLIEHVRSAGVVGNVQDVAQPVYGWFAAGCHWNRRTEQLIGDAGFRFDRLDRHNMAGMRLISGVARVGDA
jgi:ubiquinone/menaquinone biosynthesis C-methylase UbiE